MFKVIKANLKEVLDFCDTEEYIESAKHNFNWIGVESFDDMKNQINTPLKREAEAKLGKEYSAILENSVCGFLPNVPAYLNNEPMNMFNMENQHEVRLININLYICISASVCSSQIEKNGKILADYLENYTSDRDRFQVNFITSGEGYYCMKYDYNPKHDKGVTITNVCNHNDYLTEDVLKLITMPAFYRYYMLGFENKSHGYTKFNINSKVVKMDKLKGLKELDEFSDIMDYMDMETNVQTLISKYN